jgi:hypothetical protein
MVKAYGGQDWRAFLAMPGPLLDAFINRRHAIRAQGLLDMAEAVFFAMVGGEAYAAWRQRYELMIHGEAPRTTTSGKPESVLQIRARREAGRAERDRQRRLAAEA